MIDEMSDYDVLTHVEFRFDFDGNGNLLSNPETRWGFVIHTREVFAKDKYLSNHVSPADLKFNVASTATGMNLEYYFSCCDADEEEAESFSEHCFRAVQEKLEKYGCKVTELWCYAYKKGD